MLSIKLAFKSKQERPGVLLASELAHYNQAEQDKDAKFSLVIGAWIGLIAGLAYVAYWVMTT